MKKLLNIKKLEGAAKKFGDMAWATAGVVAILAMYQEWRYWQVRDTFQKLEHHWQKEKEQSTGVTDSDGLG